jgi:hypothetical protein
MVKIVNGVIQGAADSGEGASSSPSSAASDSSSVIIFGYKIPKWMVLVWLGAAFFVLGVKGLLLVSGVVFAGYITSNRSNAGNSSSTQVGYIVNL